MARPGMDLVFGANMRWLQAALLSAAIAASFNGCATDEPNTRLMTKFDPPPRRRPSPDEPSKELVPERLDVAGVVATDVDRLASGRTVVLVDARGERHEALTDPTGAFSVGAVSSPYDITVLPSSSLPATVYLGLRRADPYIELFERDGPVPVLASQTMRVGVRLGESSCATSSGWVTVATTSASGAGSTTTPCGEGETAVAIEVEHAWQGAALVAGEAIDVHALVEDEKHVSFAYARIDGVVAAAGTTTDVGEIDPAPIGATSPVTVRALAGASGLADWLWTTSVSLDLSGDPTNPGPGFLFAIAPAASVRLALPLIPGATMRAGVFAQHPRGDGQGAFYRSTETWSGGRTLSADFVDLDVAVGPEIVRPAAAGTLSRRGLGFEWDVPAASMSASGAPAANTLATVAIVDASTGKIGLRVFTVDHAIPLERLGALGISTPEVGSHSLDLATVPGASVDDAASPDAAVRRRRYDRGRAGLATFLRVSFRVTE